MMIKKSSDKVLTYGLLAAISLGILMQGALDSWSLAVLEILLLALLLIWIVKCILNKKLTLNIPAAFYPLAVFWIYGVIQSLTFNGDQGQISSLSLDPEATFEVVKTLAYLIIGFIIAANFISTNEQLKAAAGYLTLFGGAYAVFAIVQYFVWNDNSSRASTEISSGLVGTFVNRNHFAGVLEMIIPLPIALILTGVVRERKILYGFAAVMMMLALVLSLSRGGMISIFCGLLITLVCTALYKRRVSEPQTESDTFLTGLSGWKPKIMILAAGAGLIGAVILGTIWLGAEPVINRISNNEVLSESDSAATFEDSRGWIWDNTINIIRGNLLTGTGLGSFETVYPNYSSTDETYSVNRAHNDYLQVLSDTGIIGGIICLWFLVTIIYQAAYALREADPLRAGFAIGCTGAFFAMLVHSVFDFNLQLPSNALLFLTLSGALAGLSTTVPVRRESTGGEVLIAETEDEIYEYGVR